MILKERHQEHGTTPLARLFRNRYKTEQKDKRYPVSLLLFSYLSTMKSEAVSDEKWKSMSMRKSATTIQTVQQLELAQRPG